MRGERFWYHYVIFYADADREPDYGDADLCIRPLENETIVILNRRYTIEHIVHYQHGRAVTLELRPEVSN